MRILLITAYFPPDVGSASHLFYELGQELVERGHDVQVVTTMPSYHPSGDLRKYRRKVTVSETMAGLQVRRIAVPQLARNTAVGRGIWQFACAGSLAVGSLLTRRPDAALVYSPPLPLGLTAACLRAARGVPYILNVQDLFPQQAIDLGKMRSQWMIRFFEWLESKVYRGADLITVHSEGNREHVLDRAETQRPVTVMPNHVDTSFIQPENRENGFRKKHGLDGCFVASFAGVIGLNQDLDVILEAANVLRDLDSVRFLLVGDGVEKQRLIQKSRDMALNNVVWLPMQRRELYPSLLAASDLGLATLRASVKTPVVPSKILSIMASGRPVIAAMNTSGDAPKLIERASAGICVAPGDAENLANAVRRLFEDKELCQRLGENGRRYSVAHLSLASSATRYSELLENILSRATTQQTTPDSTVQVG